MWDSLVLEDEEQKKQEWGVRHDGHLPESEMVQGLLHLAVQLSLFFFQTSKHTTNGDNQNIWFHEYKISY